MPQVFTFKGLKLKLKLKFYQMDFWFEFLNIHMNKNTIICHDCHGFRWQNINIYPIFTIFLYNLMPILVCWIVIAPTKATIVEVQKYLQALLPQNHSIKLQSLHNSKQILSQLEIEPTAHKNQCGLLEMQEVSMCEFVNVHKIFNNLPKGQQKKDDYFLLVYHINWHRWGREGH